MALYEIGSGAKPATKALVDLLLQDSENLRGRSWAASALTEIGADPEVAIPALIQALAEDPSDEVRAVAVLSLESYGVVAGRLGATEVMMDALDDVHWKVRGNATCALPKMGTDASLGVSRLELGLRDEMPIVRGCAARALGEIGAQAIPSAVQIEPLLEDDDAHVRGQARRALKRLEELEFELNCGASDERC